MHCTADFCVRHYAGFSQIGSHMYISSLHELNLTHAQTHTHKHTHIIYSIDADFLNTFKNDAACIII